MKKILIIGSSGFIGKHLYDFFSTENEVRGISRTASGDQNCKKINVLDKKELETFFEQNHFDIIFNLACITARPGNLKNGAVLMENIRMSLNIAEALANAASMHVINFSSSSVYSNNLMNCDEQSVIDPSENNDCFYGLSKFNSEMIFNYLLKGRHQLTQLRIPMVYGEGMDPSRIHAVLKQELRSRNKITVFGEGKREISHIAVEELCQKVKQIVGKKITGTYNVAGTSISLLRLAEELIAKDGNEKSKIEIVKSGPQGKFIFNGSRLDRDIAS